MKRLFTITYIVSMLFAALIPLRCFADTHAAASCSYEHVNAAVNGIGGVGGATYGDTVTIPAGTCDWSSELVITKYMTIQGAGIDSTIITNSGIDSTLKGIMRFTPDATSRAADGLMRFTAMTLKNTGGNSSTDSSKGILIGQTSGGLLNTTSYFNIRIDHCSFYNFGYYGSDPKYYGGSIAFYMIMAFGLIDNCSFYGPAAPLGIMGIIMNSVGETYAWVDYPVSPGTNRALYVEDCHFENFFRNISTGNGARQVFRFNETESPKYDSWANTDAHGNYSAASLVPYFPTDTSKTAARGTNTQENYLNSIDMTGLTSGRYNQTRGGTWFVWGNEITAGGTGVNVTTLQEDDSSAYENVPVVVSSGGVYYECKLNHISSAASQPGVGGSWTTYWKTGPYQTSNTTAWQTGADYRYNTGYDPHIGYYWDNEVNGSYKAVYVYTSPLIQANTAYWQYTASFDGTSGMHTGTRAEMDAITTCTDGVGFWVTDEGSWNQSGGVNYLSYTGQGRLYRCSSNEWVLYYTPYTYPHPLRGEYTTPPSSVTGCTISGGTFK